ncbi:MAG: hypothetical protein OZ921_11520 [Sorangiineae bacterium]|nr:hypothetical protein [Polyangiaceae bacterium]MEB2323135.1 hypothetical protein [Sorangiineae bacterium]
MVVARAPGKLVISGAYAVLDRAPAIVTAVDRYVEADSERAAEFLTPEVGVALAGAPAPGFDAAALRADGRKLGLGSSAAILVASLAVRELARRPGLDDRALADAVLAPALAAHRQAQGGGSGVDVAASARGGTLIAARDGEGLSLEAAALPPGLVLEVWAAERPASTADLIRRVFALAARDASLFRRLLDAQADAAERAAAATRAGSAEALLDALARQASCLARLGEAAGAPIVTPEVARLGARAREAGATVLPAGAGGGDVALYAGLAPPRPQLRELAETLRHRRLDVTLGARGVHAAPEAR